MILKYHNFQIQKIHKRYILLSLIIASVLLLLYVRKGDQSGSNNYKKANELDWLTFDDCPLIVQDPFHSDLNDVVEEHYTKDKNCTPTFKKLSSLENGVLKVDSSLKGCSYRCHYQITDKTCNKGDWIRFDSSSVVTPKCDFITVNCSSGYVYGHHQIYIPEEERGKPSNDTRPNVYIFGIDAISNQMFHRYLYKTAYWAEHEMDGVNFVHFGKVGKNSMTNQYPATFGKYRFTNPNPADYDSDYVGEFDDSICNKEVPLTEQFITLVFKDAGFRVGKIFDELTIYHTSSWGKSDCKGFGINIHDHNDCSFNDFFYKEGNMKDTMHAKSCRHFAYDYFDHFIEYVHADSKKPKFMTNMLVDVSHSSPMNAEIYNQYFYDGMKENTHKFDNDFLIFWSDHGNHFGAIHNSPFGCKDTRNPVLIIIPPKRFRKNFDHPLYRNLLNNSKKVVSQFDYYATLVDLATSDIDNEDWTKPFTPEMALERTNGRVKVLYGSSLLRPITRPNTCRAARIPFHWCLCEYPRFLPDDAEAIKPLITNDFIKVLPVLSQEQDAPVRKVNFSEVAVALNEGRRLFLAHLFSDKVEYLYSREYDKFYGQYFEAYFEMENNGQLRLVGPVDNFK